MTTSTEAEILPAESVDSAESAEILQLKLEIKKVETTLKYLHTLISYLRKKSP